MKSLTPPRKKQIAMVQQAIAHYRYPLFKLLQTQSEFDWIFHCDAHNQKISTGLPTDEIYTLNLRPIRNRQVIGPFRYQTGLRLSGFDGLMMDLGWTLLSNPRYLLEARVRGIATIGWSKGIPQNPDKPESPAKRAYQKFILSLCDVIVLYGEISRDFFLRLGFPAERLFIARNTIDTRRIASELALALNQKQELQLKHKLTGRYVFGYLGGLIERKAVHAIVEAYNQVRSQGVDSVLVIAGDGPARPQIESAVAASPYHMDIILTGRVPVGQEGGWFHIFDAYLSFAQGGLGILEAMAHGKLVVSTPEKYPETELLADGVTGILSQDMSVASFAKSMSRAALHQPELAGIGERSRQRVLCEATLENMLSVIDQAVSFAMTRKKNKV